MKLNEFELKHVQSIKDNNKETTDLKNHVVNEFAFFSFDKDFSEITQPIFQKTLPFVKAFSNDYAYLTYNIANNDYYNSMLTSLPPIFRQSKLTQAIFHSMDKELKKIEFDIYNHTKNKRFLNARTKELKKKELEYNLLGGENFSTDFRLNRIVAKRILLRKFSLEKMKQTIELYGLPIETTTIHNDKDNFQFIINFNRQNLEIRYLSLWKKFILDFVPCWYDIKIIE